MPLLSAAAAFSISMILLISLRRHDYFRCYAAFAAAADYFAIIITRFSLHYRLRYDYCRYAERRFYFSIFDRLLLITHLRHAAIFFAATIL